MAKQRYGINDAYRGTVGTVIGYQWRGRWCLRARPHTVHDPRTARQRSARGLFAQVSQLASHFSAALRIGLHSEAVKAHRTEYNHFMSINRPCFTLEEGRLAVDYMGLAVAQGPVAPVGFISDEWGVMSDERGGMSEEWGGRSDERGGRSDERGGRSDEWGGMSDERGGRSDERGGRSEERVVVVPFEKNPRHLRADGDDLVYLFAWCPAMDEGVLSTPACRRSRRAEIALPGRWAGNEVHLYGFVKDYAGRTSDSQYLGSRLMDYAELAAKGPSAGGNDRHDGGGDNDDSRDSHPAARTQGHMLAAEHNTQTGEEECGDEQRPEGFVKTAAQQGDEAHTHAQEEPIDTSGYGEQQDTHGAGIEVESHGLGLAAQVGQQQLDGHDNRETQEDQGIGLGKGIGILRVGKMEIVAHQHSQHKERHMHHRQGEGDKHSRRQRYRCRVGTAVHQHHGTDSQC